MSSDQAPGEESVQVNDQYTGGAPVGELKPSEHARTRWADSRRMVRAGTRSGASETILTADPCRIDGQVDGVRGLAGSASLYPFQ